MFQLRKSLDTILASLNFCGICETARGSWEGKKGCSAVCALRQKPASLTLLFWFRSESTSPWKKTGTFFQAANQDRVVGLIGDEDRSLPSDAADPCDSKSDIELSAAAAFPLWIVCRCFVQLSILFLCFVPINTFFDVSSSGRRN